MCCCRDRCFLNRLYTSCFWTLSIWLHFVFSKIFDGQFQRDFLCQGTYNWPVSKRRRDCFKFVENCTFKVSSKIAFIPVRICMWCGDSCLPLIVTSARYACFRYRGGRDRTLVGWLHVFWSTDTPFPCLKFGFTLVLVDCCLSCSFTVVAPHKGARLQWVTHWVGRPTTGAQRYGRMKKYPKTTNKSPDAR